MTSSSLTRRTAGGVAWVWGATALSALLQALYTGVMSRLLDPADFGVMAAALLGLRFITYFSRFGLGTAVVQKDELSRDEAGIAFRLALIIGIAASLISLALSLPLATFIGEPEAATVMQALSLALLLGALTLVSDALMRRRFAYRALAITQVISFAGGYIGIGIPMALSGAGVWSLAAATLAQTAISFAITTALARPPLRVRFSRRTARDFLTFGGIVTVTGFVEFLAGSLDTLAVGRWTSTSGLGQYSRATYLVGLPVEMAVASVNRVLLPSLSRVQADQDRFSRAVLRGVGLLAFVVLVPMAAIAAAAPTITRLALGPGWTIASDVMPIVGLAYCLALLTSMPAIATEALGKIGLRLAIQTVALLVTLTSVAIVVITGPTLIRIATAWTIGEASRHLLYWLLAFPRIGIRRRDVAARYGVALLTASALALPLGISTRVLAMESIAALASTAALGAAFAAAIVVFSPIGQMLRHDVRAIRSSINA